LTLPLDEGEALAGLGETGLLAFHGTRVTTKHVRGLQQRAHRGVQVLQRIGKRVAGSTRLTDLATTVDGDERVDLRRGETTEVHAEKRALVFVCEV